MSTLWTYRDKDGDRGTLACTDPAGDDVLAVLGVRNPTATLSVFLDRDAAVALRDALDGLLGDGPRLARGEVDSRVRDVEHESFLRGFVEGQHELRRALELAVKLDERVVPLRTPGNAPSDDETDDAVRGVQAAAARGIADRAASIWGETPSSTVGEAVAAVVRDLATLLAEVLEHQDGAR